MPHLLKRLSHYSMLHSFGSIRSDNGILTKVSQEIISNQFFSRNVAFYNLHRFKKKNILKFRVCAYEGDRHKTHAAENEDLHFTLEYFSSKDIMRQVFKGL